MNMMNMYSVQKLQARIHGSESTVKRLNKEIVKNKLITANEIKDKLGMS